MTYRNYLDIQTRRHFLDNVLGGLGSAAVASLLAAEGRSATTALNPMAPKAPHFAPRAKNVIFLFMGGAPSQIDLFDPKPELEKWNGQQLPESIAKTLQLAFNSTHCQKS